MHTRFRPGIYTVCVVYLVYCESRTTPRAIVAMTTTTTTTIIVVYHHRAFCLPPSFATRDVIVWQEHLWAILTAARANNTGDIVAVIVIVVVVVLVLVVISASIDFSNARDYPSTARCTKSPSWRRRWIALKELAWRWTWSGLLVSLPRLRAEQSRGDPCGFPLGSSSFSLDSSVDYDCNLSISKSASRFPSVYRNAAWINCCHSFIRVDSVTKQWPTLQSCNWYLQINHVHQVWNSVKVVFL